MADDIYNETRERMQKSLESLRNEFKKLRSGRAHPSLLEQIVVDYYGTDTPLNQVANITIEDARTLAVSPWEKSLVPVIEKAIMASDLGLNPATTGQLIRVPLPPLTEERRKEMVKLVRAEAENARIAIRNIRRDANNQLKERQKEKQISEDDERKSSEQIQKLTDKLVKQADELLAMKEKDLMDL